MPSVDDFHAFYNLIELTEHDAPAWVSAALPAPRVFAAWPDFPKAALIQSGRVATGRGLSETECRRSALGEAIELASCCVWGDEKMFLASAAELGPSALSSRQLLGYNEAQYAEREKWNAEWETLDWRPKRSPPDDIIAWMAISDAYSGNPRWAPADAVLIGRREAGDEEAVAIGDSNGCAAGDTLDAAKCTAVLELIERDALARWWYGRRKRATVRLSDVTAGTSMHGFLAERSRRTIVFAITTDIGIPAFAAVSSESDGSKVIIGSAAGFDAAAAARSALAEMLQMELNLASDALGASALWKRWCDVTMNVPPLSLRDKQIDVPPTAKVCELDACLDACEAARISLSFADLTRPEFGIPVIRALSPDLCHFKPRFARKRLLAADGLDSWPQELGGVPNPVLLLA